MKNVNVLEDGFFFLLIHYSFLVICYELHETFDGIQQRSGKARLATTRTFEFSQDRLK